MLIKNLHNGSGLNWTYQLLPPHMQGVGQMGAFVSGPAGPSGVSTLWGIAPGCIASSVDDGDTWSSCWTLGRGALANFSGVLRMIEIKDERIMFLVRGAGYVPLRTRDGGGSWEPLESLEVVKQSVHTLLYSWSGKTLVFFGNGGEQSAQHPHTAYVWKSVDDGDTWTDETDDIVTMGAGIAQWYESTLYMNSGGQGTFAKAFE